MVQSIVLSVVICLMCVAADTGIKGRPEPKLFDPFLHAERFAHTPFLIPLKTREEIPRLLNSLPGFSVGAELGVQLGIFSLHLLSVWSNCKRFYAVDLWAHQANYTDLANANDDLQEKIMKEAMERLQPFAHKVTFVRNTTMNAALTVPGPLDFVFVDARHDFCGAYEDIATWWPKIRPGGIMAGHDYHTVHEQWEFKPEMDYGLCANGKRHPGAVQGAVNLFAMQNGLSVSVTYGEPDIMRSWVIRKPLFSRV